MIVVVYMGHGTSRVGGITLMWQAEMQIALVYLSQNYIDVELDKEAKRGTSLAYMNTQRKRISKRCGSY